MSHLLNTQQSGAGGVLQDVRASLARIEHGLKELQRPKPAPMLTLDEMCGVLRIGAPSVRALVERGELRAVRVSMGKREVLRFDPAELKRFMEKKAAEGTPEATRRGRVLRIRDGLV